MLLESILSIVIHPRSNFPFCSRSPFPGQHGSAGRIRPPLLGLSSLPNYPRPSLPHKPPPVPASIPKTTKLQPEEAKEGEGDPTTGVPQPATEENEVEGPPLSSKISPADAAPSQDIAITLVPVTAVCVLVVGLGMGVWSMRNKFCGNRKSKEDTVRGWDSYYGYSVECIVSEMWGASSFFFLSYVEFCICDFR